MSNCKCGRVLRAGETQCPACASKKSNIFKRTAEVVGGVIVVLGTVWYQLSKKDNDKT